MVDTSAANAVTYLFSPLTSSLLLPLTVTLSSTSYARFPYLSTSSTENQLYPSSILITTYHPGLHIFILILRKSHHILISDTSTYNLLPHHPSITFYYPTNTSSTIRTNVNPCPPIYPGLYPCQSFH